MKMVKLTFQHTLNPEVSMKSDTTFAEGRLTVQKWGSDFMEECLTESQEWSNPCFEQTSDFWPVH